LTRKDRFTDYIEIIDLIGKEIEPEFKDTMPLASGRNLSPPLYFEAVKYLKLLNELVKTTWKKFQTNEKIYDFPKSQINWNNYLKSEFDPTYKLKFPCKENILSEFHLEYFEIKFVYEIARNEIYSVNTPQKIRLSVDSLISYLDYKLKDFNAIETKIIKIKNSDPIIVKHVKIQASELPPPIRTAASRCIGFYRTNVERVICSCLCSDCFNLLCRNSMKGSSVVALLFLLFPVE